ncbi:multidrug efflux pump protein [Fulvitalea axinellae]|uniref:Multidrug efflux pump protein n=1 Tax=Fulvitalea axinellae TaxID=1182444 RepID=A0AAU9DBK9_9BACT|nr:multidrug efflux pump protein [Fulvitalea axinellae]
MGNKYLTPFRVILIFTALSLVGLALVPKLSLSVKSRAPGRNFWVSYSWWGSSPRILEREVTSKVEAALSGIRGIAKVSSKSGTGYGSVNFSLIKQADPEAVRFEANTLLRNLRDELPEGVRLGTVSRSGGNVEDGKRILTYTLNGSAPPVIIRNFADEKWAKPLRLIKGVKDVHVSGAEPYIWRLTFDAERLANHGLSHADISSAIREYLREQELGNVIVEGMDGEKSLRFVRLRADVPDIGNFDIPIKKVGDRVVRLSELVHKVREPKIPRGYFRINGLNAINVTVTAEPDENTLEVGKRVKAKVEELLATLPAGYGARMASDDTIHLSKELDKILFRTGLSLLILLVFVWITARSLRYLGVVAVGLFTGIASASILYHTFDVDLNLYALAGLTISLGILIDNTLIMGDHFKRYRNRKVFRALLASTLTTLGALAPIFLLPDAQRAKLDDFSQVLIINLSVSLATAFWLVPALMEKMGMMKSGKLKANISRRWKNGRRIVASLRFYGRSMVFFRRFRWAFILLLVWGFGLPLHLLPEKMKGEEWYSEAYNKVFASELYTGTLKKPMEKWLGGSFRLFSQDVFAHSSFREPGQTKVYARARLSVGSTLEQVDELVRDMENMLAGIDGIERFVANVNANSARIEVIFPADDEGALPFEVKSRLEETAMYQGGADWQVYGVGKGFNNAVSEGAGYSIVELEGYDYAMLMNIARRCKAKLETHGRIKKVDINGSRKWEKRASRDYRLEVDPYRMATLGFGFNETFSRLERLAHGDQSVAWLMHEGEREEVFIASEQSETFDVWAMEQYPVLGGRRMMKLKDVATKDIRKAEEEIRRENQRYQLVLQFDFNGPRALEKRVIDREVEGFNAEMPVGFKAKRTTWRWSRAETKSKVGLVFLVILIIYGVCAALSESLLQPLVVVITIPVSFVGVFLTFYLFDFGFDQGGYASFLLLSGLSVNGALYLINDYNAYRQSRPGLTPLACYIKAFRAKMTPVLLTILSTALGMLPFIWQGDKEVFWFALAVGTIGGLLFSLVALVIFVPMLLRWKSVKPKPQLVA